MEFLNGQDFSDFEKHYPSAANFLRERKLRNERRYLKENGLMLNKWQRIRLAELDSLFGTTPEACANMSKSN
jgi:hypothetical protein